MSNYPNFTSQQFVQAAGLNAAFNLIVGGEHDINARLHTPGLINPASATFSYSAMTVTTTLPSPFCVLFGSGALAYAHGTATNADTQTYTNNFTSLVPGSGSVTAYLVASVVTIQQNPFTVVGPPQGHPSYSPNFVPYTAYSTNLESLALTATLTAPDNVTTFEIGRATLTSGQTSIGTLTFANWYYASSLLNPTGIAAGSYQCPTVTMGADGRVYSIVSTGPYLPIAGGTVTGNLTVNGNTNFGGVVAISGPTTANFQMRLTGAPTNQNNSDFVGTSTNTQFRMVNDAYTASYAWCTVSRSGYNAFDINLQCTDAITLIAPATYITGTCAITGAFSMNGNTIMNNNFSFEPNASGSNHNSWGLYFNSTNSSGTTLISVVYGDTSGNVVVTPNSGSVFSVNDASTTTQATVQIYVPNSSGGANLKLVGNGGTNPAKTLRAINGLFEIVNNAYTAVIWQCDDSGNITTYGTSTFYGAVTVDNTLSFGVNGTGASHNSFGLYFNSLNSSNSQLTSYAYNDVNGNLVITPSSGSFVSINDGSTSTNCTLQIYVPSSSQGANIKLVGNGSTTPGKSIRAYNGTFQLVNSAYSAVIWQSDDSGNITVFGNETVNGQIRAATGISASTGTTVPNLSNFPSYLSSTAGYKKYPDASSPTGYYIEQWGFTQCNTNAATAITLPITFPTGTLNSVATYGNVLTLGYYYSLGCAANTTTLSVTVVSNNATSYEGVSWRVIGY